MSSQRRRKHALPSTRDLPSTSREHRSPSPQRARSSSRTSTDDSIDRFTAVMASLLKQNETNKPSSAPLIKGEVVPEFNPEDKRLTVADWCHKVDELRDIFQWSEEATIYFAMSKLRGLAEVWYRSQPTLKLTWEEWKQKLEIGFPSKRDYCFELENMLRRKKRPEESYTKYYYEKLAMLNECDVFGTKAVSCLIGGISDVVIKAGASAGNHQTPESLYSYLSSIENISGPSKPIKFFSNYSSKPKPFKNYPSTQHRNSNFKITCHKCKQTGHTANTCRIPTKDMAQTNFPVKKCDFCRKVGHTEDRCFQKRNSLKPSQSI